MIGKFRNLFLKKTEEQDSDKFEIFLGLVENFLKREYPKIKFDYTIKKEVEEEQNLKVKKTLFIEGILRQFVEFRWEKITQESVKKDLLWKGYGINSLPNDRLPFDFFRRKELVFLRDEGVCNRCGNKMEKIQQIHIIMVQDIKDNGGYNVENIILLCPSCYNVLQNQDKEATKIPLKIAENLYNMV